VDAASAGDVKSYAMSSYTYLYSSAYGSDEVDAQELEITQTTVSDDKLHVHLKIEGLRELYVHELHANGVKSARGKPLVFNDAYYTLNRIPKR
jgi:hypothetical protein